VLGDEGGIQFNEELLDVFDPVSRLGSELERHVVGEDTETGAFGCPNRQWI
jgi:hypothetical protein